MAAPRTWDIFCAVVDNYGDIGVCWRLARQLAAEHGAEVRLWVDDPASLARIWPAVSATAENQRVAGVTVWRWREPFAAVEPAEVVIEAFACELPPAFVAAMAAQARPPLWLNLEYLSAEDWVAGCHGLPSPQPGHSLVKYFFFPGFGAGTGGLLRETGLMAQRRAFDAEAQRAFLAGLGVEAAGAHRLSLFAYENTAVPSLLSALAAGPQRWLALVPEGRVLGDVAHWLGETVAAGSRLRRGALELAVLPFLTQADYDRLLWCCELNAVRGEDSFVRAQWAGAPLLWHIYPQQDGAHRAKLEAFLAVYAGGQPLLARANRLWNTGGDLGMAWRAMAEQWPALQRRAAQWADGLAAQPDLAASLVRFCADRSGLIQGPPNRL